MLSCLARGKPLEYFKENVKLQTYFLQNGAGAQMEDNRRLTRTQVRRNACIVISNRVPIMHCTVRDVTNEGARLSVASSLGLPLAFQLSFDSCRSMRQCSVVWIGHREVGVKFVY